MLDFKFVVQLMVESLQKFVAGMAIWHDKMASQRGFSRTHRPYVQVVDCIDPWKTAEILGDFLRVNLGWNGIKGVIHCFPQ